MSVISNTTVLSNFAAIDSLDTGTASLADLLTKARPPLRGDIDQLNRLAPLLDDHKSFID